jgi:hypothetical protein
MNFKDLVTRLDLIENAGLTLATVKSAEDAARDKAVAEKTKGGWTGFTSWDPKTAGNIAVALIAQQNKLEGLFNSDGDFVVAYGDNEWSSKQGQSPRVAPPTPADWKPLASLGLIPDNAKGPAGLTDWLTGGKSRDEFTAAQQQSAGMQQTDMQKADAVDALINQLQSQTDTPAAVASADNENDDSEEKQESAKGMYESLVESFGYIPEAPTPKTVGDVIRTGKSAIGKFFGQGAKAAEEALVKELGEKVKVTNNRGEVEIWTVTKPPTNYGNDRQYEYWLENPKRGRLEARISPADMKARKDAEPKAWMNNPNGIVDSEGKAIQVPAPVPPKAAITTTNILDEPIPSADPVEIVGTFMDWAKTGRPDLHKEMVKMTPAQKTGFTQAVGKKLKTVGYITLAILVALFIWWLSKYFKSDDKKVEPVANAGTKTSEDGSAAIGTTIPGDEMNWLYINAGNLAGQSITKGKDGVWKSEKGATAVDPEVIKKIEEIAKQSPEQRKKVLANQNNFSAYLWDNPASGGGNPNISISQSAPVPSTTWGVR